MKRYTIEQLVDEYFPKTGYEDWDYLEELNHDCLEDMFDSIQDIDSWKLDCVIEYLEENDIQWNLEGKYYIIEDE